MTHLPARITALTATAAAVALIVSGCSSSGGSTQTTSNKSLVVDNTFDLKTSDPARAFELTGSIVDKALYETALTFEGSDVTKPVAQLTTYAMSSDNKTITLKFRGNVEEVKRAATPSRSTTSSGRTSGSRASRATRRSCSRTSRPASRSRSRRRPTRR